MGTLLSEVRSKISDASLALVIVLVIRILYLTVKILNLRRMKQKKR